MQSKDESDTVFQMEYMEHFKNLVACVRSGRMIPPTRDQLEHMLRQSLSQSFSSVMCREHPLRCRGSASVFVSGDMIS